MYYLISDSIHISITIHISFAHFTFKTKLKETDKLVRCDVIVDKIDSIRIKHTTTHLDLDSPESFTVEAFDDEV